MTRYNDLNGHFPDSQDQRNTVRVRMRYQAHSRGVVSGIYGIRQRPAVRIYRRPGGCVSYVWSGGCVDA